VRAASLIERVRRGVITSGRKSRGMILRDLFNTPPASAYALLPRTGGTRNGSHLAER
jgi:hypothetical protein